MGLVITGWGVISPIGIGVEEFIAGFDSGRSGKKRVAPQDGPVPLPPLEACTIPDFDVAKILGTKKGTRVLDRTAALAVAATAMAIRHSGIHTAPDYESGFGVVLGTSNGTMHRTVEYTVETLHPEKPYMVSPEAFPNTVMNFAAGQCAIAHRLRALNTTVSGGRLACITALRYASRMIQLGYADGVLTGSVEELSPTMVWGASTTARARGHETPLLGEGGAMFTLERSDLAEKAGRKPLAELLACEAGFHGRPGRDPADTLAACIERALGRAGLSAADVLAVSLRESGMSTLDGIESRAVEKALGGHRPARRLTIASQVGECFSASGSFQISALLAMHHASRDTAGRVGLVTSVTHGGAVGCALLRGR
jgi:3-oxoacyl-[acyl-carrier-protein] synthase II